jgi:hypothetical protein
MFHLENIVIAFNGALESTNPDSLKQFFLTHDSLLPLEWRINFLAGEENLLIDPLYEDICPPGREISRYFERIVSQDHKWESDIYHTGPGKSQAKRMWLNLSLKDHEDPIEKMTAANRVPFAGIDLLAIPIQFIEENPRFLDCVKMLRFKIDRIDILTPVFGYTPKCDMSEWGLWASKNNVKLNTISLFDPEEVDAHYSWEGHEGQVDPVPEPYIENGKRFSPTGDALFYKDGFFLNTQEQCEEIVAREPIAVEFDPIRFPVQILEAKVKLYTQFANEIENKKSIFWAYFNWVANHVRIRPDYNFIPDIIMPEYFSYRKRLVKLGLFIETQMGLLRPGTTVPISIIELY